MRKFLLFCVFFICLSGLRAQQSFNKAYHSASQIAAPIALTVGGSYYHIVKVKDNNNEANQAFLYKHSNDSTLLFRKPIYLNNKLDINQAFVTKDKAIMVLCNDVYCSNSSFSGTNSYLIKIDTSGNQVFNTAVYRQFWILPQNGDVGVPIIDRFKNGVQNADSTYSVFSDSVMFKFSVHGLFLSRKNLGTDSITAVTLLPNNNILMNGHIGNSHGLIVLTQTGSVISMSPLQTTLKKLLFYNGNKIIGLGNNGNLYKITPNYGLISNTNFASNTKVTDFISVLDTIYTCRLGPNATSSFFACDTSFNVIYNSSILTKSLTPAAICKYKQKIIFIGNSTSNNQNYFGQNYFSSISVFDKSSTPAHNLNIAISKLSVDTAFYLLGYSNHYETYFDLFLRFKFYAKNNGNAPIKSFKFTYETSPIGPICGISEYYQQSFTGLNILPGDSLQLVSGIINRSASVNNSGYSYPGIPQNHCVYLTVPNNEVDKDQSDNEKCVIESFHGLGMKATGKEEQNLIIYPNPFNNELKIESEFEIKTMSVKNVLGQTIKELQIDSKTIDLNTEELDQGIYFITIETEKGRLTKKIIKN